MSQIDSPAPVATSASRPKPRSHWVILGIIALLAFVLAWKFGDFQGKQSLALVTSGDGPYWDPVLLGANDAARIYEVDLTVVRCKTNVDIQTQEIDKLLSKGFDGVAISPISPTIQATTLSKIADSSTLLTFDSDSPVSRRLCFVGTDNYNAGRLAGKHVRDALPDGGEVIICVGNLDKENTQHRRQGVIDELLDRTFEPDRAMDDVESVIKDKDGKYSVVATLVDGSEPQRATELAAQAMKDHPNVKCFVGLLSYTTPSILKALEQANKVGQIKVVGFDAQEATLSGVESGSVTATILQDQYGLGFHAVRILAEDLESRRRGEKTPVGGMPMFQRRTLPCEMVTKENVAAVREQLARVNSGTAKSSVSSAGAGSTQPAQ